MRYIVQYLEPGPHLAELTPKGVAERLRETLAVLPIEAVLLGWELPRPLVETCAAEATRFGAALYLWHPLLTAQGAPASWPAWRTVGADGQPTPSDGDLPEFTFLCPNHPEARAWVWKRLDKAVEAGPFAGVFLDRIRWPSPTGDLEAHWACFCPFCRKEAKDAGLDLALIQRYLHGLPNSALLRAFYHPRGGEEEALTLWARWRAGVISEIVREAASALHKKGYRVGLDLWSPSLAPLVGQSFEALAPWADWVKGMVYLHTWGPAGLPYEMARLVRQIARDQSNEEALAFLADLWAWPLDEVLGTLYEGLGAGVLYQEIKRAKGSSGRAAVWVGLDLVEISRVCHREEADVRAEMRALRESGVSGLVLSWDLWHIPPERLGWLAE